MSDGCFVLYQQLVSFYNYMFYFQKNGPVATEGLPYCSHYHFCSSVLWVGKG